MAHISFFFKSDDSYVQVTSCESNRVFLLNMGAVLSVDELKSKPVDSGQRVVTKRKPVKSEG